MAHRIDVNACSKIFYVADFSTNDVFESGCLYASTPGWVLLSTFAALLSLVFAEICPAAEAADPVLRGGPVVTIDDKQPEAEAVAVRGERIVAVGSAKEIEPLIGPKTKVIELAGRMAMPGFI